MPDKKENKLCKASGGNPNNPSTINNVYATRKKKNAIFQPFLIIRLAFSFKEEKALAVLDSMDFFILSPTESTPIVALFFASFIFELSLGENTFILHIIYILFYSMVLFSWVDSVRE